MKRSRHNKKLRSPSTSERGRPMKVSSLWTSAMRYRHLGSLFAGVIVMYVDLTDFKSGYWIGVHYVKPLEKEDGTVNRKH